MGAVSSIYQSIDKQLVEMYASNKKEKGDNTGFLRSSSVSATASRPQQVNTRKYILRKKK